MLFFAGRFLSTMLGKPVRDRAGLPLGRLRDIAVLCTETFPRVTKILVRPRRGEEQVLLWDEVRSVSPEAITLEAEQEQLTRSSLTPDECWLARSVLDRQIVDLRGRRLVRVNDLQVAYLNGVVRLVAVDAGSAGLLRRLGLGRLGAGAAS